MLFSSPLFLHAFLPALLLAYQLPGRRTKNLVLFLGSLVFYAWEEHAFVLLLLASVVANYAFGLWVQHDLERQRPARMPVALAVAFNLALLVAFKYLALLGQALETLLTTLGVDASGVSEITRLGRGSHLPVGISFFTFQAISFVVDTQRRQAKVPRNPLDFGLYLASFPQLLAGPIVRFRDVAGQLQGRDESWARFALGVRRFAIGLGKKVLVADILGSCADEVFALDPDLVRPAALWLGTISFWGQIYFDFSGYSDMAIGLGHMFGFRFPENFKQPYAARSMSEFWRRWHITLSSWFLDYMYFPLIGRKPGKLRVYTSLFFVLTACGLWHGASWHFVVVGMLHGALLAIERMGLAAHLARLPVVLRVGYTNFCVGMAWVVFRSPTLGHAWDTWLGMFGLGDDGARVHAAGPWLAPWTLVALVVAVLGSGPWFERCSRFLEERRARLTRGPAPIAMDVVGLALLALLLVASFARIAAGTLQTFVYFRF